mgnify:CR=1 FL=1
MKAEQYWRAALGELEIQLSQASYYTWFRNTKLIAYEDNVFVVGVETGFIKDWLDGRMRNTCLLYTSPSPRDATLSRMQSSA